jgi:hypothetical protein
MNSPRIESRATEWTERYERLRQHALGGPAPTLEGLPGLAVLHPGGHPAREGSALLQGIVLCGQCGQPMGIHYARQKDGEVPIYICQRAHYHRAEKTCQTIPGRMIDEAVGALVVASVTPQALEMALAVQNELEVRLKESASARMRSSSRALPMR